MIWPVRMPPPLTRSDMAPGQWSRPGWVTPGCVPTCMFTRVVRPDFGGAEHVGAPLAELVDGAQERVRVEVGPQQVNAGEQCAGELEAAGHLRLWHEMLELKIGGARVAGDHEGRRARAEVGGA